MKLYWEEIHRTRKAYPHKPFVVHALFQSGSNGNDKEMLGYIIKSDGGYWSIYIGDQRFARTSNLTVSKSLIEQKKKFMAYMAD